MAYTPATERLIKALQALPGVGTRSAQRMALHLLERDPSAATALSEALGDALERVRKCSCCRTLTEEPICEVCADPRRDQGLICVVASDVDKSGIEMSGHFKGRYFVLHGLLSPIDGIGPAELGTLDLVEEVRSQHAHEVILALDEQMEAEATSYYISEQLKSLPVKQSRIRFTQMKSGALDKTDSHIIGHALAAKQEIGFEHD